VFTMARVPHIEGYSMNRILLAGLILPAFVILALISSFYVALSMGLPTTIIFFTAVIVTFAAFGAVTFLLIRQSDRIMNFAKVKKKC
jgi:hypothetical protein